MEIDRVDPFPGPTWLHFGSSTGATPSFHIESLFPAIFAIVFFVWLAYSLVAAYHWFRYGHRSFLVIPMLAVHVFVSGALMILATTGLK
jgi:hypothetical protein